MTAHTASPSPAARTEQSRTARRESTPPARRVAVPVLLQAAVHALVAALLVIALIRAVDGGRHVAAAVTAVVVVGAVYAAGPLLRPVRRSVGAAGAWVAVLLAAWVVLLALTPDAIWLAFPWFFLLLYLLPWRVGIVVVVIVTAVSVVGFVWHEQAFNVGIVIGPVLGALVAIATVWGYLSVAAESDRRRALIAQLRRTRADLAVAERAAGAAVERERLAREIHDTIAQGLSSIQMLLHAAQRALPQPDAAGPDEIRRAMDRIEQARTTAQDNLAEARRFVRALAPPGLHGRSLPAALRRLCATVAERSGLAVTADVDGGESVAIPTAVEVVLLRIAQSAMANVVEHAAAHAVRVALSAETGTVRMAVIDDGAGFDPAALAGAGATSGYGIPTMRARAAEAGGTLTIDSRPGDGTAVRVVVPLGPPEVDDEQPGDAGDPMTQVTP